MPKELHIVALGSSFAAGAGIPPYGDENARRSKLNYAEQLVATINATREQRARLTDRTVSGATILNVLSEHQHIQEHSFVPQLSNFPGDVDIVTFTCGGNDIRYISSLTAESAYAAASEKDSYISGVPKPSAPEIPYQMLTDRIGAVIDEVHRLAPNAIVYLVQYLSLIGDDTRYDEKVLPLSPDKLDHYRSVADNLANAYYEAAKTRKRVEVVPTAKLSRGHALGSSEPWVTGLNDISAPYHPNKGGHGNVAEILYKQIFDGDSGAKD